MGCHKSNKCPLLFVIRVLETQLLIWSLKSPIMANGLTLDILLCDECSTEQLDGGGDRLEV